jgi:hypothetical protein
VFLKGYLNLAPGLYVYSCYYCSTTTAAAATATAVAAAATATAAAAIIADVG